MSPENTAGPSLLQWALGALATIFGPLILVLSGGIVQIRDQTRDNTRRIESIEKAAEADHELLQETHDAVIRIEGRISP